MTGLEKLGAVNWDFAQSPREDGLHSLHPYPAKFISAIPRQLIAELSLPGETILDPFCGSGTALVEALALGRPALGADVNPVAVLLSQAKTQALEQSDLESLELLLQNVEHAYGWMSGRPPLGDTRIEPLIPRDNTLDFWFQPEIIQEMGIVNAAIASCQNSRIKLLARVALSSITVGVSNQDSDTRYVRRTKSLRPGIVVQRFRSKMRDMVSALATLPKPTPRAYTWLGDARKLPLAPRTVDLVVTSPPYPNAYSYHLYHRTRLVWLGFDPLSVKESEIGSHRHYSARNGAGRETFLGDMLQCFQELRKVLRPEHYACFVIGDSIVRGQLIDNSAILHDAAEEAGFALVARYNRNIDLRRKSFNPVIGKIKQEHILIFRAP